MRILTVRQPWAWAIIHGGKNVENRVRNIAGDYRGPIAIHAGLARFEDEGQYREVTRAIVSELNGWPADDGELWGADSIEADDPRFIYGAIVGVVEITAVHRCQSHRGESDVPDCISSGTPLGMTCSPWAEFRRGEVTHHLVLANPRPLAKPIPHKGALGLRTLDPATVALIREQVSL